MPPNRPNVQAVASKLVFTGTDRGKIGSDRIQLLEAIRRNGSISKAAKVLGLSYKAAWDAVIAMNNLFPSPLVERQTGGKRGGGAVLTPRGETVLKAMREAMAALDRFARGLIEEGARPFGQQQFLEHDDENHRPQQPTCDRRVHSTGRGQRRGVHGHGR